MAFFCCMTMDLWIYALIGVGTAFLGFIVGSFISRRATASSTVEAKRLANQIIGDSQRKAENQRKESEIEKREKEIDDHKRFVERFKAKPTKARQAKSKAKQIDKIVIDDLPRSSRRYPRFKFVRCRHSGRIGC